MSTAQSPEPKLYSLYLEVADKLLPMEQSKQEVVDGFLKLGLTAEQAEQEYALCVKELSAAYYD